MVVGGVHGGDPPAVLEHGDPVGEVEDLGEPVRDVQEADAALLEPAHERVEQLDLVVGERGGRLVHDEQPGVQGERLGDLDDLLLRRRRGCRTRASAGEARSRRSTASSSRGAVRMPAVDEPAADRLVAEEDVLGDGALRAAG